jgi:DNA-binding beta-propeller fold protein YncE
VRSSIQLVAALVLVFVSSRSLADDVAVETVLTGMSDPSGLAIRPGGTPERYEIFVADRGARRIVKMLSNEPNRSTDVITGFPFAVTAGEPVFVGNPASVQFLDEKHLAVGVAGAPPEVLLYELAEAALNANAAKQRVSPQLPDDGAEGDFGSCVGLARTRANDYVADMLLVAVSGGDQVRGVWKIPVRANMLGTISRLDDKPGEAGSQVSQPVALTMSEQGFVVAVDAGSRSLRQRLTFLNPTSGQLVLGFQPELGDIRGVAYSPKTGNLYALATGDKDNGEGLFRLDDASKPGERQVAATKLASIERPTALAFGPDGALYVTSRDDDDQRGGTLLKVVGEH